MKTLPPPSLQGPLDEATALSRSSRPNVADLVDALARLGVAQVDGECSCARLDPAARTYYHPQGLPSRHPEMTEHLRSILPPDRCRSIVLFLEVHNANATEGLRGSAALRHLQDLFRTQLQMGFDVKMRRKHKGP